MHGIVLGQDFPEGHIAVVVDEAVANEPSFVHIGKMLAHGFKIEKLPQSGVQLVVIAVLGEILTHSSIVLSTFDEGEIIDVLCQPRQLHRILCLGVFCQRPQLVQINIRCVNGGSKAVDAEDITKKAKRNNGELPMYYVENNHPAIIERVVFDRVQEEVSRRNSKRKTKQVGTKTELGRYSSKYALSEILFCGDCGTPYRRCTWTNKGKKKVVWRCISRLDYGTKYCKASPSIEESVLHTAIAEAITQKAHMEDADIDRVRRHIELYQSRQDVTAVLEKQERLKALQAKIDYLTGMDSEEAQNGDFDAKLEQLFTEMYAIQDELNAEGDAQSKLEQAAASIDEMATVIQGMRNHPVEYDDQAVRQLIECIKVISAETIHIYFKDGTKIVAYLNCP